MAVKSCGTKLMIGANSVAELTSISGIELSADTIETTTLDATSCARTFIGGLIDGGEVSISGFFNPNDTNGQAVLLAGMGGSAIAFTITFPSTLVASWSFNGIVTAFSTTSELEDAIAFECTLKVTGLPTLGTTASGGLTALALTGAGGTLSPTFATGNRSYTFGGVSATSVTVTATAATHTILLYIDGVYSASLTSGSPSSAISLTLNVGKKLTIVAYEAGKVQQYTDIIVIKTS